MRKYRRKTLRGGWIYPKTKTNKKTPSKKNDSKKNDSKKTKRTGGLVLSRRRRRRRRRRNTRT